jgi:ABC-type dipeptide/oligopeptide/nickel transport system permease component
VSRSPWWRWLSWLRWLVRRLLAALPLLAAMSVVAFAVVAAAPGDPVRAEALRQGIVLDAANEAALRASLGLDGTLVERYARWLGGVLQGDFGLSTATRRPVAEELVSHVGATLALAAAAMALALPLSLAAGLAAALARGRAAALAWRAASLVVVSTPGYWLALLALQLFAVHLGWARVIGDGAWHEALLPAAVLALGAAATSARVVRERALQVMSEDPWRGALALGLPPWRLITTRLVPPVLVALLPLWAAGFGALLGGAVVVETVFGWPGLGRLVLASIAERDLPVLQAYLLAMGLVHVLANLLADALSAWLDPRLAEAEGVAGT